MTNLAAKNSKPGILFFYLSEIYQKNLFFFCVTFFPPKRTANVKTFKSFTETFSFFIFTFTFTFSRHFYPKRLTVHSGYTFVLSVCVFPGN